MMSEQDFTAENSSTGSPATARRQAIKTADHCHGRLLDLFKQSLTEKGEAAYAYWGMGFSHSLDEVSTIRQKQMLGLQPKDALDFYNFGCLAAMDEQWSKAKELFAKALELNPELNEAVFNSALVAEKSGDTAGARQLWETYLQKIEALGEAEEADEIKKHISSILNQ